LSIPLSCHIPEDKIVSFSSRIGAIVDKTLNLKNTYNPYFCYKKWKLQIGMCAIANVVAKETFDWEAHKG